LIMQVNAGLLILNQAIAFHSFYLQLKHTYLDAFSTNHWIYDQIKTEVQRVENPGYQRDGSSNVSRKGTPKNS
jgi:hypothetical protein